MFADIDASSIVSLIGKPVWVFTEARKFNRNGRIYTASNVRNAIYKGSIQTIQIETVPVSQGPSKGWLPACFATVAVSISDENGVSKYSLYLERQLLNVTVFETEDSRCHRRRCSSLHLISLQALGPLGSGVCFLLQSRYTVSIQKIKITTN